MKINVIIFSLLIGFTTLVFGIEQEEDQHTTKPNVIYILADDLGYGDIRVFNPKSKIPTPNIDKLASQGMMFTDAHSGSSVCTPTRYGIMTGRYAWRTRLQKGVLQVGDPLIAKDRLTVGKLCKQNGYTTALFAKWHLGEGEHIPPKGYPNYHLLDYRALPVGTKFPAGPFNDMGYDYTYWHKIMFTKDGQTNPRRLWALIEDDTVVKNIEQDNYIPLFTELAVNYIKEKGKESKNGGQPFYMHWAPVVPHTPIAPSKKWQGKGLSPYADFIMELDWTVGQFMKTLDELGIADNTLIVFTSDNGPYLKPAKSVPGHTPTAQFRGGKADIWDGGHRVPFIVRWPNVVKPETQSDQLICLTDFMATLSDILDTPLPQNAGEDSKSILPVLKGEASSIDRPAVIHHTFNGYFAIRKGKWKLNFCSGSGGWSAPHEAKAKASGLPLVQLYDMETDPGETKNLQAKYPGKVKELARLLKKYVDNGRSTKGEAQKNDVNVTPMYLKETL